MEMIVTLKVISFILFLHWLGDFVLQSDWMAKNKSHSIKALSFHVFIYGAGFFIFFGWRFALINMIAHFVVDYFTSKLTKKLWEKGDVHNFFVVIGADQYFHTVFLLFSYFILEI